MNIIAQILGALALLMIILSIQQKEKVNILKFQTVSTLLYSASYLFLGAYAGAITTIISFIRTLIYYNYEKKEKETPLYILLLFIVIIIIFTVITYDNQIYSIIPAVIAILLCYSNWQKNTTVIRVIYLITTIGFVVYNYKVGIYIPFIGNIFELIFAVIAIFRYDIKNKKASTV